MSAPTPLALAWRVFTLDSDGCLHAPWALRFGTDVPTDAWRTTVAIASCASADHDAPAEACFCGLRGVVDLGELLARIGEAGTVAAIARVRLFGRMLEGCDVPDDDPPTTLRAERAELLELHLAPQLTSRSGAVADKYPRVPVYRYAAEDWPAGVPVAGTRVRPVGQTFPADVTKAGEEAFVADVMAAGFGLADLDDPGAEAAILKMGRRLSDALRRGYSYEDLGSQLFNHEAEPTLTQVRTIVLSALRNLCPEAEFMFRQPGYTYAEPIRLSDIWSRMFRDVGDRLLSAAVERTRGA